MNFYRLSILWYCTASTARYNVWPIKTEVPRDPMSKIFYHLQKLMVMMNNIQVKYTLKENLQE